MPRTYGKSQGKAKQTRLSFVPAAFPPEDHDDDGNRHARLRYSHPSMSTLRRGRSAAGKNAPTPLVKIDPVPEESSRPGPEKSSQKRSRRKRKGSPSPRSTPPSPLPPPADSDSESDIEVLRSARKSTRAKNLKRKRSTDSLESEKSHASEESDAEETVSRPRRKLRRGAAQQPIVLDDGSSDLVSAEEVLSNAPRTPLRDQTQDRIDLEEDLEALQDSVVRESRTRGNIANSARVQRQQHLEALRRRRVGKRDDDNGDDQQSPESRLSEPQSEGDGEERSIKQPQFRGWAGESGSSDVESSIGKNEDLDKYEEDFVIEDEDDKLGVPNGLEDMPIEFSRHSYKQLKDYFKDAVEWMVYNQLNPAFPRSHPMYQVAFGKLEAEVRGRTGSQLVSSVWNADFRRALLARPQIEITSYPTEACHPCDACNRSGHPASSDVKLSGKAYSLETLEPLSDADSDDDDSVDEANCREKDRDGYSLPDDDTRFYLGRHCMKNAQMAHTLTHWRFHLNEWVIEHLRVTGYMSDAKTVERSHLSQKKRTKHAIKAVEKMVKRGEIKKLWRDFHINLRTARELTAA
ncbi:hypothetical protein P175DRAFT_0555337 [Aspergillus ochraceoroseus IBT 24754]|uniref:DUF4211 domain-containing protein n=1 Tax=Aspergillus ochraceoroseus IBT 24754 TaxID=1392256 RepID=A0A2T5M2C4_9EURO|nr:uncharacterized protein P175DRAFT_0555337 [Aspergillus ochraceoroseus IBT 24754]PTU22671.1 hypothetical protein P175DRAFT_0555337 [Aspergillus ochraceoroseus IBT 24754]